MRTATAQIRDFRAEITDAQVADLRDRLARTRWPEPATVDDWSQGIPLSYTRELCEYWATEYDMRRLAARLNAFPQFHATIGDLGIHFLHVRSPHERARPVVMTHGWPGSVVEFLDVIGPLTDPEAHGASAADAFHLVIPALPGFGFSDKPSHPGTGIERIAGAWHELMVHLGYPRYYAQGGDWGSAVTTAMAAGAFEGLLGVHLNVARASPEALSRLGEPTEREREMLARARRFFAEENGYAAEQATRPQTIGYSLADSPAGQLAWIVEKFYAWADCDGHPENAVSRDNLLDNVMMYWLTNSAASSARMYWENARYLTTQPELVRIPAAYTQFPEEIFAVSERWLRTQFSDLRYYHAAERGGHFAAFEQPEIFAREVRAGIAALAS
ncbi:epoxide hydrolase family protein [Pseudonocardia acaciae]|uniref:epoxide hydrolase family protein n=1 Tax=Pseudonocardia acaciae TaxID=551276 RepID=UPI000569F5F1|nr:epoxide hydrolase family protein [Pseudonocardia acaciae]